MTEFTMTDYENAKSWPFIEAKNLAKRLGNVPMDQPIVFETGYGPSGLPHIGTFGEVARTTMVRQAFEKLTGRPTRLICFSDDMDGMRKVPGNAVNPEKLEPYLQMPLSRVPDPGGSNYSYAAVNNNKLQEFLDQFGFEYEFISATHAYSSGMFDAMLLRMLEKYDDVMNVILPTIGEERRQTYSPFLPISPSTGRVLYVPMLARDVENGTVTFEDEDGSHVTLPVTGGNVKLQWKADWAGRWYALGVNYEMAGEDLTESTKLSSQIVKALGGRAPAGFNYQLFLDEEGKKISKTKGNGITIDEWLRYASPESLSLYMFQAPKKAKKLYFDIIPKTADEYWQHVGKFAEAVADADNLAGARGSAQNNKAKAVDNPAWHIHGGNPPAITPPVSFALLLNIVNAAGISDPEILAGFIKKYRPDADQAEMDIMQPLYGYAVNYFEDFVKPKKQYRAADDAEKAAIEFLISRLTELGETAEESEYHTAVFDAGKSQNYENLRAWFKGLYEVTFGQSDGPRMGPFIKIFGAAATVDLLKEGLAR